ncbi:hypothetical protein AB0L97_32855 [Nocardia sp. NPDC051911]|uniref:hypothetical protein n=1 Tax=Nocardia sp. NPDC051911 TaxID=3154648 RepID=UPI00342E3078
MAESEQEARAWFAAQFPHAQPWQAALFEQVVKARREGRQFVMAQPPRRGRVKLNELIRRYLAEHGVTVVSGRHEWGEPVPRKGVPVLPCKHCPVVWWPDRTEPRSLCRSRPRDKKGRS